MDSRNSALMATPILSVVSSTVESTVDVTLLLYKIFVENPGIVEKLKELRDADRTASNAKTVLWKKSIEVINSWLDLAATAKIGTLEVLIVDGAFAEKATALRQGDLILCSGLDHIFSLTIEAFFKDSDQQRARNYLWYAILWSIMPEATKKNFECTTYALNKLNELSFTTGTGFERVKKSFPRSRKLFLTHVKAPSTIGP